MTSVRRLSQNTVLYALGTLSRRVASLLLIPIYTSALGVSGYGALETLTVIVQTLLIVVNFGLSQALLRFYVECRDETEVLVVVRTSSVLVLGLSFGLFGLCLPFFGHLGVTLFKDEAYGRLIALAFLWAIGGALNQQLFAYFRARQDARTYVAFSVGMFLALMVLNISFVRGLRLGVQGVLLGNLIAVWSVNLWLVARFWRRGRTISWQWAGKLLRFGSPLVFSMLGWLILNSADRYFLAYYRDLSEVGIYGLGYKVGLLVQMAVIAPFQLAWGPFVFAQSASTREHARRDFSRVFTYLVSILGFVSLTVLLFSAEIVDFLGAGKFTQAVQVVPYVLLAYLFNGIYYWAGNLLHLVKRTALLSVLVFSMAVLNLLLNWAWVPTRGWNGAALSTLVTIGGAGLLTLLVGQRLYPVPLQRVRLVKLAFGMTLIVAIVTFVSIPVGVLGWLARGGLLLLPLLLLLVTGFFEPSEIRFLTKLPGLLKRKIQVEPGKTV